MTQTYGVGAAIGSRPRGPGRRTPAMAPRSSADRAGRALARVGEHVGPHVQHRQHVVAIAAVRGRRSGPGRGEVEPRRGVEGVEVRPYDDPEVGRRELADVAERVGGPDPGFCPPAGSSPADASAPSSPGVEVGVRLTAQGARIAVEDAHRACLPAGAAAREGSSGARRSARARADGVTRRGDAPDLPAHSAVAPAVSLRGGCARLAAWTPRNGTSATARASWSGRPAPTSS